MDVMHSDYEVLGPIGRGNQGSTWRARHTPSGALVAIKTVDFNAVAAWKEVELFEREAEALERLQHPAVPDHIEAWVATSGDTTRLCLAQEFIEGRDLRAEIAEGGRWTAAQARDALEQLLEILSYLHDRVPPIVHRDIKPSNIVRRSDGRLVLVDFGAAQTQRPGTLGGSTVIGTPGYMPMEQMIGQAEARSDLYAAGVTVGRMFTGIEPSALELRNNRLDFRGRLDQRDASSHVLTVIERLTQPAKEDRYASARDALDALRSPSQPQTTHHRAGTASPGAPRAPALQVVQADTLDPWFEPVRPWIAKAKADHRGRSYAVIDRPLPETLSARQRDLAALGFACIGRQSAVRRINQQTRTVWRSADGAIYAIEDDTSGFTLCAVFDDGTTLTTGDEASHDDVGEARVVRTAGAVRWDLEQLYERIAAQTARKPVAGLDMDRLMAVYDIGWFRPVKGFMLAYAPLPLAGAPQRPDYTTASIVACALLTPLFAMTMVGFLPLLPLLLLAEHKSLRANARARRDVLAEVEQEARDGRQPARAVLPPLLARPDASPAPAVAPAPAAVAVAVHRR